MAKKAEPVKNDTTKEILPDTGADSESNGEPSQGDEGEAETKSDEQSPEAPREEVAPVGQKITAVAIDEFEEHDEALKRNLKSAKEKIAKGVISSDLTLMEQVALKRNESGKSR